MQSEDPRKDSLLCVRNLDFRIGESQILNAISLNVSAGETVGIVGPNGSGKTTLFNCLSGFARPSGGSIQLNGRDISALPPFERARLGLGRVFQNYGIFREMTLLENLLVALERSDTPFSWPWGRSYKQNVKQAMQTLTQFDLGDKAYNRAASLSGGQLRLLEIARTVALGSKLLLLDEPTAGVSPKMKTQVERGLAMLRELGKTLVIIEHDMSFIERLCQRIIAIDIGSVVLDDTPSAVRSSPLLAEIYFGKPVSL